MKARLAKICPLLPFAVYGVLLLMRGYLFLFPPCDPDFSKEWEIFLFIILFRLLICRLIERMFLKNSKLLVKN